MIVVLKIGLLFDLFNFKMKFLQGKKRIQGLLRFFKGDLI